MNRIQWLKLGICVIAGVLLWFIPYAGALPIQGRHVFAVFFAVILSFVLRPMAMGASVLLGLVVLWSTGSLEGKEALAGYSDSVEWLVLAAFLVAGAVIHTGFGRRIALLLVRGLGRSTLGLGYALCSAEFLLAMVVPSNTARGGGILAPITQSLAKALGSEPEVSPQRAGAFLCLTGAHANLIAASTFLTGMAANPLVAKAAQDVFGVEFGWGRWALGAIVPGLVSMALLPLLLFHLARPELTDARAARAQAGADLEKMGPWSRQEILMGCIFVLMIVLWISKPLHGMGTTLVALMGVCLMLVTGTERWENMMANHQAWDTFMWLGGLMSMAGALKTHGWVAWFAGSIEGVVSGVPVLWLLILLGVIYFYSMYAFSMVSAHISALAAAFFAIALATSAPPLVATAIIAYFSTLCACTTNYSTGPVIIYFGLGYVPARRWFRIGFPVSLFHLLVWFGLGLPWWYVLGWW